jgi:hypothetical protein
MLPGRDYSYSDHFGLEGVFAIKRAEQSGPSLSVVHNPPAINSVIHGLPPDRAASVIEERMVREATEMSGEALLTAVGALTHEYRSSQARTQKQLAYFYMAVVVLVLVLAGSSYITCKSWVPQSQLYLRLSRHGQEPHSSTLDLYSESGKGTCSLILSKKWRRSRTRWRGDRLQGVLPGTMSSYDPLCSGEWMLVV